MSDRGIFKIINEKGTEETFNILFTFDLETTNKSYVVYTDYSQNEKGDIKIFAATYENQEENAKLGSVKTEEELNIINSYIEKLNLSMK